MMERQTDNTQSTPSVESDFDKLIAERPHAFNRHRRLCAENKSLVTDVMGQPYVNRSLMSVRATISTPTVDRAGDLLIPMGCVVTDYAKAPVVLWNHGLSEISVPIGTSNDREGRLSVRISEDEVQATSFFSQSLRESVQIFELIDEGIIKATSVRETPLSQRVIYENGERIAVVDQWSMEEWSFCPMGVNPDAVTKTLCRNRLDGKPIVESIMKSLLPYARPIKKFGKGFEVKGVMKMTDSTTQDTSDTSETADMGNNPYGKNLIDATHGSLKQIAQMLKGCLDQRLENPDVKAGLQGIADSVMDCLKNLEGLHASSYKDLDCGLKSDDMDGGEGGGEGEEPADDSEMKSLAKFVALKKVSPYTLIGLQCDIKSLITADNLQEPQRRKLSMFSDHFDRILSNAKSLAAMEAQQAAEAEQNRLAAEKAEQAKEAEKNAELQRLIDETRSKLSV